jgi:hypothetical protein
LEFPSIGLFPEKFAITSELFGEVLRTFLHEGSWRPGDAAIFEGVEHVREVVGRWYDVKVSEKAALALQREEEKQHQHQQQQGSEQPAVVDATAAPFRAIPPPSQLELPKGVKLVSSEPVVDRKSVFVGHCAGPLNSAEEVRPGVPWSSDHRLFLLIDMFSLF